MSELKFWILVFFVGLASGNASIAAYQARQANENLMVSLEAVRGARHE